MAMFDAFRPEWKRSDPLVRKEAVRKVGDEKTLLSIALNDPDPEVRMEALQHMRYQASARTVLDNDRDASVRMAALGLITDQRKIEETDSNRYRILEQAAALDNRLGELCVRYQIRAEDRGAESEGTPEQQAAAFARWLTERPPVMDIHGYRCIHPNAPQYEVEVSYSQRGKAERLDESLSSEGEAFVGSFHFVPLK